MSKTRRFLTTAALALCAILPTGAMAQNVLVLTTDETNGHYTGAITRLKDSLATAGATVTTGESLTTGDISGTDFSAYQIVVVATGQGAIREDSPGPGAITNFTTLENQIKNNATPAFIILSDGCTTCVSGSNDALGQFLRIVNEATNDPGMQLGYTPNESFYDPEASQPPAQRNDLSMYSQYFSAASIKGQYFGAITGAYEDNRIYGTNAGGALAIFVPSSQMNGGATTFLAGDLSIFKNGFSNNNQDQDILVSRALVPAMNPNSPTYAGKSADVLLLTTEEASGSGYPTAITNLQTALDNNSVSYHVKKGLTTGDISGIDFSAYKTVIVATGEQTVSPQNFSTLEDQIKNYSNTAFVIFSDGCQGPDPSNPQCGSTLKNFADILGLNAENGTGGAGYYDPPGAQLATATSQYSNYFSSLPNIQANTYGRITGARIDNQLYGTNQAGPLAVFMPQTQVNGGAGACTFLAGDLSIFQNSFATQHDAVIGTLVSVVNKTSDACTKAAPPPQKMQATVLYLSTAEGWNNTTGTQLCTVSTADEHNDGRTFINNAKAYFRDNAATFIDRAGALSTQYQIARAHADFKSAVWIEADFDALGPGDVVVVQSGYKTIDPQKAEIIVKKIKERSDLTFILLLDTCQDCGYDTETCTKDNQVNMNAIMLPAIDEPLGWGVTSASLKDSTQWTSKPDAYARSAYASSLAYAVNQLGGQSGNSTSALQCAPQQNILYPAPAPQAGGYLYSGNGYTDAGWYCNTPNPATLTNISQAAQGCSFTRDTSAWPELNASSSFGLLVPFWQSNNGQGACTYLGQDNNAFDAGRCNVVGQCGDLARMFLSLPAGACAVTPQQAAANASALSACANLAAGERCILAEAPAKPDGMAQQDYDETLAVLHTLPLDANGEPMCKAKVWCNSNEEKRPNFCDKSKGEDESTHCCKNKPYYPPPTGCCSAPTTGWPALLGLSALLPLLAVRRRRRK